MFHINGNDSKNCGDNSQKSLKKGYSNICQENYERLDKSLSQSFESLKHKVGTLFSSTDL
jgi:hypothetical protein